MDLRLIIAALVAALSLPAWAHTPTEQDAWIRDWVGQVMAEGYLSSELLSERLDFLQRHAAPSRMSSRTKANYVHRGMGDNVERWRPLVAAYPWDVDTALCLMSFESGGNPDARNPSSGASGLMQVLPSWTDNFGYTPADLFTPEINLVIAYTLYADGGWGHWSPWLRGECH